MTVDVDAFSVKEAAAGAAAHWDVERDVVEVEGQRRWWTRWLGVSTHEAAGRRVAIDRDWWYSAKLAAVVLAALATAWVVHLAIP